MRPSLPIGVFDSGMGGLTVLRALRAVFPRESFLYLGDTARLPYGTKSAETVKHYALQMARVLVERGIKALVIACNTATTAALGHLQDLLPDIPVLGVIEPGAAAAAAVTANRKIMVLATETTIASGAYHALLHEMMPSAVIAARAAPLLVALAEEGLVHHPLARMALGHYLSELKDEDTILLGCTHFPVFEPLLAELLSPKIHVVDSAVATATALELYLREQSILNLDPQVSGSTYYLVTDSKARFQRIGEIFLSEALLGSDIELIDV